MTLNIQFYSTLFQAENRIVRNVCSKNSNSLNIQDIGRDEISN